MQTYRFSPWRHSRRSQRMPSDVWHLLTLFVLDRLRPHEGERALYLARRLLRLTRLTLHFGQREVWEEKCKFSANQSNHQGKQKQIGWWANETISTQERWLSNKLLDTSRQHKRSNIRYLQQVSLRAKYYSLHGSTVTIRSMQGVSEAFLAKLRAQRIGRVLFGFLDIRRTNQLSPLVDYTLT